MKPTDQEQLMIVADLAVMLAVPVDTLYGWRHRGVGPAGYRIGRDVRYRRETVEAERRKPRSNCLGSIKNEPKYLEMVKEAGAAVRKPDAEMELVWRSASAAAHGKGWFDDYAASAEVIDEFEPGARISRDPVNSCGRGCAMTHRTVV